MSIRDVRRRPSRASLDKAMLCPRPTGERAKIENQQRAGWVRGRLMRLRELELLEHIAKWGDHIAVEPAIVDDPYPPAFIKEGLWLLVPMSDRLLDVLAEFGADGEDVEDSYDREHDHADARLHDDADMGEGFTWPHQADQTNLNGFAGDDDAEEDDPPEGGDEREKDEDIEYTAPERWTPIDEKRSPPVLAVERVKGKPHDHPTLGRYEPL